MVVLIILVSPVLIRGIFLLGELVKIFLLTLFLHLTVIGSFLSDSDSKNGAAQIAGRGIEKNRRRNLYTTLTANGDLGSLLPGLKANLTF